MSDSENQHASIQEGGAEKQKTSLGKKFILLIAVLLVLMLVVQIFSSAVNKTTSSEKKIEVQETNVMDQPSANEMVQDPLEDADILLQDAIDEKHMQEVKESSGHGKATTKSSVSSQSIAGMSMEDRLKDLGLEVYEPPKRKPVAEAKKVPEKKDPPPSKSKSDINPYTANFRTLYASWDKPIAPSQSVNLSIPQDVINERAEAQSEDDNRNISNQELSDRGVRFLQVYSGTLELGYNSDTGGLMVVSVHLPGLRDVKFQAETQIGAYNERAAIELVRGVTDSGEMFDVSGVIVDQNDRIPSIKGKVNRHIIHNTIYGFATTFLDAFAAYKTIDSGAGVNLPIINTGGDNNVDTDGVIVGNAASSVSRSVKQLGEFRPNTLTKKAFTTVGVVFLPERN
jgi:hypothetical protein